MKGKARRKQFGFENTKEYGKVDRLEQKSIGKEVTHYQKSYSGGFVGGILSVLGRFIKFFFNNSNSVVNDKPVRYFNPVKDILLESNPNRYKGWYKTHVPKSMRAGLTTSEILTLRKKIYHSKEIYV